jgi:predicted RNA binding protein YcfA (HicA-like mRNA interferase family)
MKVGELISLLEENDWYFARRSDGHRHFKHQNNPLLISVDGNDSDDIPRGSLAQYLRKAGLKRL